MGGIDAFVLDGRVTVLALGALVAELCLVVCFRRRAKPWPLVANALSGMALIMALRAALVGPDAAAVALWLGLALAAHLADLASRPRR